MALRTPPSWLQNGSHPAENDRLNNQALLPATGVIGANSLFVTASGSAMSVSIGTGWGSILSSTAAAGVYGIYNDAATSVTITAADPTNPRIDRIVATVNDSYYSGSLNNVVFAVVTGTAAASPVAPATPTNSISLATVAVAALATVIVQGNVTDTRVSTPAALPAANNYYSLSSARSLTAASTADQSIFNVSFTLQPNTLYEYEVSCVLTYTQTAVANSVNAKPFTTTAAITSFDGYAFSGTPSGTSVLGFANLFSGGPTATATVFTSSAAATYSLPIVMKGTIRTNTVGSGVFTPQIAFTGAGTSVVSIARGGFVKMNILGPASSNSVGAWA